MWASMSQVPPRLQSATELFNRAENATEDADGVLQAVVNHSCRVPLAPQRLLPGHDALVISGPVWTADKVQKDKKDSAE